MNNTQNRIKEVRKAAGLTQTEFGERIGIKGNTITCYEKGIREPSEAIILAICREFNVREQWLRTGEGEMFQPKTRKQEIADFMGKVLNSEPDDLRSRLVEALAQLDESDWAMLAKIAKKMLREEQKNADP